MVEFATVWVARSITRRHPRQFAAYLQRKLAGKRRRAPSVPLESARQFPICDAAIVLELLPSRGVHVVLDHVVPERVTQQM